jgi:rubrerythrin
MPEFLNPFPGLTPDRKISKRELTRSLRLSLAAEEEAIHLYEALADATDDPLAKKVLQDIADEERVHVGEFQGLLNILLEDEQDLLAEGAAEVNEMSEEVSNQIEHKATLEQSEGEAKLEAETEGMTVGGLKTE